MECAESHVFSSTFGSSFCISKHSGLWLFPLQPSVSDQLGAQGPTEKPAWYPSLRRLAVMTCSCLGLPHLGGVG